MQLFIAKAVIESAVAADIVSNAKAASRIIHKNVMVYWPRNSRKVSLIGSVEDIAKLIGDELAVPLFAELNIQYTPATAEEDEIRKTEALRDFLRVR